ncbi:dihydrofolate reductase [Rhodococcus sp. BP-332]|uniref:dihydrofolate reductase family protein n=1 Tax=Rhodococcus sp. BP-332 TaxID=2739447 RepID=UPI001C9A99A8|nr:dihydrofolate reductase family protein [Rhodococcus sp. BP-332]MBY6678941.1 dihydrofolate reductase [Rhodococcus sp. BP-332]
MATITAFQSISTGGVIQGLGRPDEDDRGGFVHGGWGQGYQDEISMSFAADGMSDEGALLFGRRTYEDLLGFWTTTSEPNPFTDVLVRTTKYVVSRSTDTTLEFPDSHLVAGDAVDEVRRLKERTSVPLTIMGSGELVRSLHAANLIDEYVLQIHPIVLGSGTQLFGTADRVDLELVRSVPTTTGVIIAHYVARR